MRSPWKWLIVVFLLLDVFLLFFWWQWRRERSQDGVILAAAAHYHIDPALVKAVVWRESRFDPDARGKVGEIGLMQLRAGAAGEWAQAERVGGFEISHLSSPATNTLAGSWYLAKLLRRYAGTDDPVPFALADYNAGRTHVLRWSTGTGATNRGAFLRQVTFPATRKYVEVIERRRERYEAEFRRRGEPCP